MNQKQHQRADRAHTHHNVHPHSKAEPAADAPRMDKRTLPDYIKLSAASFEIVDEVHVAAAAIPAYSEKFETMWNESSKGPFARLRALERELRIKIPLKLYHTFYSVWKIDAQRELSAENFSYWVFEFRQSKTGVFDLHYHAPNGSSRIYGRALTLIHDPDYGERWHAHTPTHMNDGAYDNKLAAVRGLMLLLAREPSDPKYALHRAVTGAKLMTERIGLENEPKIVLSSDKVALTADARHASV